MAGGGAQNMGLKKNINASKKSAVKSAKDAEKLAAREAARKQAEEAAYRASPAGRIEAANQKATGTPNAPAPVSPQLPNNTAQNIFGASSPQLPGPAPTALEQSRQVAMLQGADAASKSNESLFQDTSKVSGFASQGLTQQEQTQQQTSATTGQTNQQQATTATGQSVNQQVEQGQQQQTQQGQATTNVVDTLGLGALLKDQTATAQASDATRQAFLSNLVAEGDPKFNQKMDTAIRASQSGQVQNAGESAKARIGAYAAERVAQDNQNQRLTAAAQLAGPTASTNLAQAGNAFLGQQTATNNASQAANTNVSNATQNTTQNTQQNTQQQTSQLQDTLSKLLSTESANQQGVSQGLTSVNSVGKQPTQQSGGGMSVICTVLKEHGLLSTDLVNAEVAYFRASKARHYNAWKAYYAWAGKLAKWMRNKPAVMGVTAALVRPLIAVPAGRGNWFTKPVWHVLVFAHHVAGWFIEDGVWDPELYDKSLELDTNLFVEKM